MSAGGGLLRQTLRGERRAVTVGALLLGLHQGTEALVPVVVGATLDAAIAPSDGDALLRWLVILAALFLVLANAYRWGVRFITASSERAAHELRMRLVDRVLDLRGGGEGGRRPGELVSVATADVDATANVTRAVGFGVAVAAAILTGAVVLLTISVPLGLLVLVGLPLALWAAARLAAPLERRAAGEQAGAADAAGVAADLVAGHRVLQGLGATATAAVRYRRASRAALDSTLGAARAEAIVWGSANLVAGVALAAVALVGGQLAARGEITIGQLIAAVGVTQFLVGPLQRLAFVGGLWVRARASAVRVADALAAPPAVDGSAPLPAAFSEGAPVGLSLRGVCAGPLRGVDLDVSPGELRGVVAEPGAVRALLDVLGEEAEPDSGAVFASARGATVDLASVDPAAVRRLVVVVPHDAALLADTPRADVELGGGGPAAVDSALAASAADELDDVLPDGLDTPLGDDGAALSGGQRQRVALARSLATAAPVLVLHDPTTALDAVTEARVAAALRGARAGATTLLVTTSPGLLSVCDTVTVLRDGGEVASAAPDVLARDDADYRATVLA